MLPLVVRTANYLENWKCISVLKADGASSSPVPPSVSLHTPLNVASSQPSASALAGPYQKEKSSTWLVFVYFPLSFESH